MGVFIIMEFSVSLNPSGTYVYTTDGVNTKIRKELLKFLEEISKIWSQEVFRGENFYSFHVDYRSGYVSSGTYSYPLGSSEALPSCIKSFVSSVSRLLDRDTFLSRINRGRLVHVAYYYRGMAFEPMTTKPALCLMYSNNVTIVLNFDSTK